MNAAGNSQLESVSRIVQIGECVITLLGREGKQLVPQEHHAAPQLEAVQRIAVGADICVCCD
jgi:hypothetical protein